MTLQPHHQAVFDALRQAADNGMPCPTNYQLAEIGGWDCPSAAGGALKLLQELGLIELRKIGRKRVVTVEGKSTAEPTTTPGSRHTPESDGFIKAHYKNGMGATEIGERLGMTKNMIVSRAYRLGLRKADDNPVNRVSANSRALEKGADKRHRGDPLAPVKALRRISGGLRHKECQWIEGDPRIDPTMCGAPVLTEGSTAISSYCPEHHERCWVRRVEKRAA